MQVFTAVLVVVFGGLGIWFNDEKFFKTNSMTATWIHEVIVLGIETNRKKIDVDDNMVKGGERGEYGRPEKQDGWSK